MSKFGTATSNNNLIGSLNFDYAITKKLNWNTFLSTNFFKYGNEDEDDEEIYYHSEEDSPKFDFESARSQLKRPIVSDSKIPPAITSSSSITNDELFK